MKFDSKTLLGFTVKGVDSAGISSIRITDQAIVRLPSARTVLCLRAFALDGDSEQIVTDRFSWRVDGQLVDPTGNLLCKEESGDCDWSAVQVEVELDGLTDSTELTGCGWWTMSEGDSNNFCDGFF